MSSGVILLQRPYFSFSSPLLLILRWEITAAAVALLYMCERYTTILNFFNMTECNCVFLSGERTWLILSPYIMIVYVASSHYFFISLGIFFHIQWFFLFFDILTKHTFIIIYFNQNSCKAINISLHV